MAVLPAARLQRFGKAIVLGLERLAGAAGAARLHLLTQSVSPFFEALGFRQKPRDLAPASIAATAEFQSLCGGAAYLVKAVRDVW